MPQVGKIEYPVANIALPIKFTVKTGLFSCTYAGTLYQDTQIQALREKVLLAIKNTYTLDWTAIIVLSLPVPTQSWNSPHFSLTKERKYVAYHQDFGYKQVNFTASAEGRLPNSQQFHWREEEAFTVPKSRESHGQLTIYLPYSDALWEQIEEIEKYLIWQAKS
jgi:hypothetical protein